MLKLANNDLETYKVIVIGDASVGKTSLTYRFCEGKFHPAPECTIGADIRQRRVDLENESVILQLWDTAGMERHRNSLADHYYRNVQAIIFVYDVTSPKSFESIKTWIHECEQYTNSDPLKVMVANKCDMEMCVSRNMAQKFADDNNMPLFETSAKSDSDSMKVDGIFVTLALKLKNERPLIKSIVRPGIASGPAKPSTSSGCC